MKLPPDSIIAPAKLHDFLLKLRDVDDKSGYLLLAGYDRSHAARLERDIRALLSHDAELAETTEYREMFCIRGTLSGPNGRQLRVASFWAKDSVTGRTRFVTLYPDRS